MKNRRKSDENAENKTSSYGQFLQRRRISSPPLHAGNGQDFGSGNSPQLSGDGDNFAAKLPFKNMPTISNSSTKFARIDQNWHQIPPPFRNILNRPNPFHVSHYSFCPAATSPCPHIAAFGPLPWLSAAPRKPSTAGPSASGCAGQHGYR